MPASAATIGAPGGQRALDATTSPRPSRPPRPLILTGSRQDQGRRVLDHLARVRGPGRDTAGGLAALGLERGQTIGDHAHQPPRVPLVRRRRAAPRRHAVLALQHVHAGADRVPAHRCPSADSGHRAGICRSGSRASGHRAPDRRRGRREDAADLEPPDDFDFDAAWKAVEPDDLLTLIYTRGTTGPPKGVQITHANMVATIEGIDEMIAFPDDGRLVSWLPMAHIAERTARQYLPMFVGLLDHLLSRPAPGRGVPARGAAHLVLRRAAHLGEAQGGHRGGDRGRAGRGEASRPPSGRSTLGLEKVRLEQAGRRCDELGGAREGRRARAVEDPREARLRPGRGGERGRGAHSARGDRVLPRPRHPARRAVGDVRDHRLRRRATRPTRSRSARSARRRRAPRSSSPTTARC